METTPMSPAGGVLSKIILIVWMPGGSPSPVTSWAHLAIMRRFLRDRGISVLRCFCHYNPPASPDPNLFKVFSRRDGIPVEHYGPLQGFCGLGILPVGSSAERGRLLAEVSEVLRDPGFRGALAAIRHLIEDPDDDYPFGFAATEAYREYLERHGTCLIDSDGRRWSDEEIEEYKRWRMEPGDRCLELIEGALFPST